MDYAALVKAIQEGDQETANLLISEATPILIRMLKVRLNANQQDAEDAVQQMFLYVIEAIRKGRIQNPSGLLSYMIISARHNYLKLKEGYKPESLEEQVNEPARDPDQLSRLINRELQEIYVDCIEQLKPMYREFYIYYLQHEDINTEDLAERFGISINNVWTRKHRIVKQVRECVRKQMEK